MKLISKSTWLDRWTKRWEVQVRHALLRGLCFGMLILECLLSPGLDSISRSTRVRRNTWSMVSRQRRREEKCSNVRFSNIPWFIMFLDPDPMLRITETPKMYSDLIEPWTLSQSPSRINWSVESSEAITFIPTFFSDSPSLSLYEYFSGSTTFWTRRKNPNRSCTKTQIPRQVS